LPIAAELASQLWAQHQNRVRFEPITSLSARREPARAIADAYAVQEELVHLMIPTAGEPAGYKIGLTTRKMQSMCGIDEPVAGRVLSRRVRRSPARVAARDFVRLGVESELCLVLGEDLALRAAPYRLEDVERAVGGAAAAFELVEDRGADYARLDACSLIADNSWNAGVVLGEIAALAGPRRIEVGALAGALFVDDQVIDRGSSADAMSHPFAVVLWLANHLQKRGQALRAGDLVMTGSIATTKFAKPGERYRFELEGLAPAELGVD
jgi:2-keto-4-pentenoate hydratase